MPPIDSSRTARWRAVGLALAPILAAVVLAAPAAAQSAPLTSSPLRAIDARSAALLMSGQQGGDLEVRLRAVGVASNGAPAQGRIELVLDVAAEGLAPAEEQESVLLAVHVYALDRDGRVAGWLRQGVRLEALALAAPWQAGVKFLGHLALPPGDYRLRVLAVRPDTGAFGLVFGDAQVAAAGAAAPSIFVLEPAERWLVVRQARPAGAEPGPEAAAVEDRRVPSAEPVVRRTSDAELRLLLRDAEPSAGWLARLAGAAERELELAPAAVAATGWRGWQARLDAGDLPAGEYRLELLAPAASEPADVLPVRFADPSVAERAEGGAVWTDLGVAAPENDRSLPLAAPGRALALDAVERRYLEALGVLADGDERGAVERLIAIEPAAIADGSIELYDRLEQLELQVAADLAQIDPDSLLPLVWLHALAYDAYLDHRHPPLAKRSRLLAERLARAFAVQLDTPAARAAAARAFESLAGRLLGGGNRFEAARMFADAIELDAAASASLRGLGLLLERNGQYAEALQYFDRAGALVPDDPELTLRRALQRLRTGDLAAGERALRNLDRDGNPEWVRVVAVEELARSLAARGARDEALAALDAAIARHPDAGLLMQQAVFLDAAGRRQDAGEVLARLEVGDFPDVDSPRLRYDRRQPVTLAASSAAFADAARRNLPQLAEARRELERKLGAR